MSKSFWVSRDKGTFDNEINVWIKKPHKDKDLAGIYYRGYEIATWICSDFIRATGIKMPKGALKKVKLVEVE